MPLRVIGEGGEGSAYDPAQAILYAAGLNNNYAAPPGNKADIINMSFGSTADSSFLRGAVEAAYNEGVTLVAASGNGTTSVPYYPAAYPHVISVAAVNVGAERAFYSNFGDFIDISAPGGDMRFDLDFDGHSDGIFSTLFNGENQHVYDYLQGTSMAAAYVSGSAALVVKGLQENPANPVISPSLIRDILINTAIDLGDPGLYGAGLVNTHGAVSRALGQPEPQIPVLNPNPKTVRLEGSKTTGSFTLKNIGNNAAITINGGGISVSRDTDGLISGIYPDSGSVGPDGLKVQVSVNTDEFKSGLSYLALIEITDSTGYTVPVNVVYKYVGDVYIVAWHLSSFPSSLPVAKDSPEIAAVAVTDQEKGYRYKLEGLGPGKYVVGASTDRDKDDYLFETLDEIFGFFPDLRYATIMDLAIFEHRSDVDFQIIDSKL
jgi:serine protease